MRLPNSIECEKSLLGCVILDNTILPKISVTVEDFYDSKHRLVYSTMQRLNESGRPIDFPTLATELGNDPSGVGNIEYLAGLMDASASAANYQHYVDIITQKSKYRNILTLAADLHNKILGNPEKGVVNNLLNSIQSTLSELNPRNEKGSGMMSSFVKEQVELSQAIADGNVENKAVKTGFLDLDVHIDGLIPGNLIVIAGRPGTGKTAFALDIVLNLIRKDMATCYYSLEMTCSEIARRLISKHTNIGLKNLMNGLLSNEDKAKLNQLAADDLMDNLFVTERNTTPSEIEVEVDKWNNEHPDKPLRCIVVDHLQLVGIYDGKSYERRDLQLGKYTALLKDMAKRKDLTIILLSQLNRALDSRNKDERLPKLSDLRDSGSIEQDADVVLGLYRRALDTQDQLDDNGTCIILKNRNGRVGRVDLTWIGKTASYKSKVKDTYKPKKPAPATKRAAFTQPAQQGQPHRSMIDPDTGRQIYLDAL